MPDISRLKFGKACQSLITRQGMNIRVEVADLESAVSLAKRLSEQMIICLSADVGREISCVKV